MVINQVENIKNIENGYILLFINNFGFYVTIIIIFTDFRLNAKLYFDNTQIHVAIIKTIITFATLNFLNKPNLIINA